jgi:DNA-binding NarL/FixJ family response regulator
MNHVTKASLVLPAPARNGRSAIKVLLAHAHDLTRLGLSALVKSDSRLRLVGEIDAAGDLVAAARRLQPDIVLMNLSGLSVPEDGPAQTIKSASPRSRLVLLTNSANERQLQQAMRMHPHACFVTDQSMQGGWFLDALVLVARSPAVVVGAAVARHYWTAIGEQTPNHRDRIAKTISGRERLILQLLAEGLTEQQISLQSGVSLRTVRRLVANLERRLDAPSLFALGSRAAHLNLLD